MGVQFRIHRNRAGIAVDGPLDILAVAGECFSLCEMASLPSGPVVPPSPRLFSGNSPVPGEAPLAFFCRLDGTCVWVDVAAIWVNLVLNANGPVRSVFQPQLVRSDLGRVVFVKMRRRSREGATRHRYLRRRIQLRFVQFS